MSSVFPVSSARDLTHHLRSMLSRMGFDDVRNRAGTVSWIVRDEGWWTLNWISVFNFCPGVVRFTNRFNVRPPTRQWPFGLPRVHHFELNAALAEVDEELLAEVIAHAQGAREITPWPETAPSRFSDAHGPDYAWTPAGKSLADRHRHSQASRVYPARRPDADGSAVLSVHQAGLA